MKNKETKFLHLSYKNKPNQDMFYLILSFYILLIIP